MESLLPSGLFTLNLFSGSFMQEQNLTIGMDALGERFLTSHTGDQMANLPTSPPYTKSTSPNPTRLSHVAKGYYEDIDLDEFIEKEQSSVAVHHREAVDSHSMLVHYWLPRVMVSSTWFFSVVLLGLSVASLFTKRLRREYNEWVQFYLFSMIGFEFMIMFGVVICQKKESIRLLILKVIYG